MQNELTRGNVFSALLKFSVPLILSGLLQQLYNIVDALIVGNLIGENALAAAGASSPVVNVFIFVLTGLVSGCTILISHAYGAGERSKIDTIASSFTYCVMGASILVMIVGLVIQAPMLRILNTPQILQADASAYLSIIFCGVPALAFYNLASSVLRGIGDSKTPLVAIIIASIINIGLDLLFVGPMKMGIRGAAIATIIAQIVSALYLLYYLKKGNHGIIFTLSPRSRDKAILREGLKLSLPRIIQSSVSSMGSFLLQNIMNSFGVTTVAAITTAYKIDSLAILPLLNVSVAISVFTGQNMGSKNRERATECLKKGLILMCAISAAITAVFVTCGYWLIKLFGVSDAAAVIGQRFFYIAAAFYPILGIAEGISGFLQGCKDVNFTAISNIAILFVRVGLSYALYKSIGGDVIAVAEVCAWSISAAVFTWRYKSGKWKRRLIA